MSTKLAEAASYLYGKFVYTIATDRFGLIVFFFQSRFKPKEFITKFDNDSFWVRKNTSDIFVLKEVYTKKVYGGDKPRGVVVDAGANIGDFSVYASNTADIIYAFEPESSNYDLLVKNIELNKRGEKIIPLKLALGSKNKIVPIYRGKYNRGASSTARKITDVSEEIEMRAFADLIDEMHIDKISLLKIDIEGGEYDLLYGLPKEKFTIIEKIILEYHYIPGESYRELRDYLASLGYKVQVRGWRGILIGTGMIEATKN